MEKEKIQSKDEIFSQLPEIWHEDLLDEISDIHHRSRRRLVILDDDPTGTQTVHGIPLLTEWTVPVLEQELIQSNTFFILTNTRSLTSLQASNRNREIGYNLKQAAQKTNVAFFVLSRSDSTLRGHYPAEVDALCEAIEFTPDATVLVPYFEAGGRYTINDTHYVHMDEKLVPASLTEFARDKSFAFTHAYLPDYVEEKTSGRIPAGRVNSISIDLLRTEGPRGVFTLLNSFEDGGVIVVNAAHPRDVEVAVRGLLMAQDAGKKYIFRTAASFVSALAGIRTKPLLNADSMRIDTKAGGLLLVGSHVKKSTEQLDAALNVPGIVPLELDVSGLLKRTNNAQLISGYSTTINNSLRQGKDVIAYTSRKLVSTSDSSGSLAISRSISAAVVELVQKLEIQPKFLIAKGGITSNDIATKGLGVRRAMVAGQLQPGIPVWILGEETKFPRMHYVVYPGNVGTASGLADAILAFRNTARDGS